MNLQEAEDWQFLYSKMNNEGFHYCFKQYSSFNEIKDKEFHKLRKQYLKIADKLENYIKEKYDDSKIID